MKNQLYNPKLEYCLTDLLELSATGEAIFPHIASGFEEKTIIAIQKENIDEQRSKPTIPNQFAAYTPSNSSLSKPNEFQTSKPTKTSLKITTKNGANNKFDKNNKKSKDKDFNEIKPNQGTKGNTQKPKDYRPNATLSPTLIQSNKPDNIIPEKTVCYNFSGSVQNEQKPQVSGVLKIPQGFGDLYKPKDLVSEPSPPNQQNENEFKITFQKNGVEFTPGQKQGFVKVKSQSSANNTSSKPIEISNIVSKAVSSTDSKSNSSPLENLLNPSSIVSRPSGTNTQEPNDSLSKPTISQPPKFELKPGSIIQSSNSSKSTEPIFHPDPKDTQNGSAPPGFGPKEDLSSPPGFGSSDKENEEDKEPKAFPPGFEPPQNTSNFPPGFEKPTEMAEQVNENPTEAESDTLQEPEYEPEETLQGPPGFDTKPPGFDSKPPGFDSKPPGFENTPPGFENGPPGFDSKPPGFDSKPPGFDSKPPGFDSKPPGFDSKPPGFDSKPPGFDSKPPGFDSKPPGFDSKPPGFENGPPGFENTQADLEPEETTYVAPPGLEPSPEMFEVSPDAAPEPEPKPAEKRPGDDIPIEFPNYEEAVAEVAAITAAREAAKAKSKIQIEKNTASKITISRPPGFSPSDEANSEEEEKKEDEQINNSDVPIPRRGFSDEDGEEDLEGYSVSDGFTSDSSNEAIPLPDIDNDYELEEESDAESFEMPPGFESGQRIGSASLSEDEEEDSDAGANSGDMQSKITFLDSDEMFDFDGHTAIKLKRGQPKCCVYADGKNATIEGFTVFACGISGNSTICISLESALKFYFSTGSLFEAEAPFCPAKCIRADPLVADRFLVHGEDSALYVVSIRDEKLHFTKLVDGISSFGASSRYLTVIRHGRIEIRDRTESSFIPLYTEEANQFTQVGADERYVYKFAQSLGMVVYFKPCSDSDPVNIMGVCRMFVSSSGVVLALKNGCLYISGQHIELPELKELCAVAAFGRDYVIWRSSDLPPIIYRRPAATGSAQTEKTATSEVSKKAVAFVKIIESLVADHNRRVEEMKDEYHRSIDTMLTTIRDSAANVEEPAKAAVAKSIECGITPAATIILYSRDEVDRAFRVAAERSVDHAVILCGEGRLSAALATKRLKQATLISLTMRLSEALTKGIDAEGFLLTAVTAIDQDDPISAFAMAELAPKVKEAVNAYRHNGTTHADQIINSLERFHI